MKKVLLILCILAFGIQLASGQAALLVLLFGDKVASENFYFSMKGGLNYNGLPGLSEFGYKTDIHFGLAANIRLNDQWTLVPEFMPLARRGARKLEVEPTDNAEIDSLNPTSVSLSRNLNYIDIPVLIRYTLKERWVFEMGPQFSLLTGANDKYEAKFEDGSELTYAIDRKDVHTSVDCGFVVSIGYIISKSRGGKGMELHFRYYEGFVDVSKIEGKSYRNRMFQASVSFPFILVEEPTSD